MPSSVCLPIISSVAGTCSKEIDSSSLYNVLRSKVNTGTVVLVDVKSTRGLTSLDFLPRSRFPHVTFNWHGVLPPAVVRRERRWREREVVPPIATSVAPHAVSLGTKGSGVPKSGSHNPRGGGRGSLFMRRRQVVVPIRDRQVMWKLTLRDRLLLLPFFFFFPLASIVLVETEISESWICAWTRGGVATV